MFCTKECADQVYSENALKIGFRGTPNRPHATHSSVVYQNVDFFIFVQGLVYNMSNLVLVGHVANQRHGLSTALDYFLNIDKRLERVNFVEINKMKKIWFEASYDSLTRVFRKDVMDYWFTRMRDELSSENKNLALIFFDVDGFKQYNDILGHLAGDAALYEIARAMRKFSEKVFRFGGDEFVIMAHLDLPEARKLAGKITKKIRSSTAALAKAASSIEVSFGAAVYSADGKSLKELLTVADERLYQKKLERKKR